MSVESINGGGPVGGSGSTIGSVTQGTTPWTDQGGDAANASPATNPFTISGIASAALAAAATLTNVVRAMFDKFGRQVVLLQAPRDLVGSQQTTITASTGSTTIVTAGAAGILTDITSVILTNSSATTTLFTISDGTKSRVFSIPANDTRGIALSVPWKATTAATAWTGSCGTSVSSMYIDIEYVNNQ